VIWAFNIVAIEYSVEVVPPLTAVCIRYVMVLAVCLPWLRWLPGRMVTIAITGVVAGALFFGLGGIAFAVTDNVSALAVAGQLGVPFSLILAVLFAGETIRWRRMTGIALAFAGVAVLTFDPAIVDERLGLALTVAASFLWAVGSLLFRGLKGVSPLTIHAWLAVVSIPLLAIASMNFEPGALARVGSIPPATFGWLAYSAVGASVIGHAGMSWLLQRYPVSVMSPLTLPTPLMSIVIAVVLLGNPVTPQLVIGGLITLVGIAIITLRTARAHEYPA
jgi:O-acetylserine/cysteine efflux transporter